MIRDFGVFMWALDVCSDRNMLDPPPENASMPNITPKKKGLKEKLIPENENPGDLYSMNIMLIPIIKAISRKPAISV